MKAIKSFSHDVRYNVLKRLNAAMRPIDKYVIDRKVSISESSPPPVFIIGPPRSGTTLLYQLLVRQMHPGYINNFVGNCYGFPYLAIRIYQSLITGRMPMDLSSEAGRTAGFRGPHEFGNFWYRWFPKSPQYAAAGDITNEQAEEIRRYITGFYRLFERPVVFKNVVHSVRIRALMKIFPRTLFLVNYRNPVYTAQSIYRLRTRKRASHEDWWSVEPRNVEEIRQYPLPAQCVHQVYAIQQQIEEDRAETRPEQFHTVQYEDICADPANSLRQISAFLQQYGLSVPDRFEKLPELSNRNSQSVDPEIFREIEERVKRLWS